MGYTPGFRPAVTRSTPYCGHRGCRRPLTHWCLYVINRKFVTFPHCQEHRPGHCPA